MHCKVIVLFMFGLCIVNFVQCATKPTQPTKKPRTNANNCKIDVQSILNDLPVLVKNDKIIVPKTKNIELQNDEKILAICPGDDTKINKVKNSNPAKQSIEIVCKNGKLTTGTVTHASIKGIKCDNKPSTTVVTTTTSCAGGEGRKKTVQFKYDGKTITIYETCYDKDRLEALYTVHTAESGYFATNVRCDKFQQKGSDAGSVDIEKLYDNHEKRLPKGYVTKKQVALARGHLAPCSDFHYQSTNSATLLYINAVPQWQRCNNANWKAVEKVVRNVIQARGEVKIYTGSSATVLQLPDDRTSKAPTLTDIYLADNNKIPVPKYIWKAVIDTKTNEGIAFVQLNEPYATNLDHVNNFCKNICSDTNYAQKPKFAAIDEKAIKKGQKTCGGLITCCSVSEAKTKMGTRMNDVPTISKTLLRI